MSVICHIGTAGGGHYICYSLNANSQRWFEFDDHRVTEVSPATVQNCEGYVLFYKYAHILKLSSGILILVPTGNRRKR